MYERITGENLVMLTEHKWPSGPTYAFAIHIQRQMAEGQMMNERYNLSDDKHFLSP